MASVKNLKKEINYVYGDILNIVYVWEMTNGGRPTEASEKLEQLRYLEYGKRIKMVETSHGSIGIDTIEDLEKARKLI
jgi:CMP-2-keto-3-deoxyoctulosonic acid synthetase